jgi:hypothetical protein
VGWPISNVGEKARVAVASPAVLGVSWVGFLVALGGADNPWLILHASDARIRMAMAASIFTDPVGDLFKPDPL